jgi:hypothetical protein
MSGSWSYTPPLGGNLDDGDNFTGFGEDHAPVVDAEPQIPVHAFESLDIVGEATGLAGVLLDLGPNEPCSVRRHPGQGFESVFAVSDLLHHQKIANSE